MEQHPTAYRVSTITCNASLSTKVSLPHFFPHVQITEHGFLWTEFGTLTRGERPRKKKRGMALLAGELAQAVEALQITAPHASAKTKKCFDNQVTVVYRLGPSYHPNCKIFRNGNIHLTGIRTLEDGERMVALLAEEVRRIYETGIPIVENLAEVVPSMFKIRMINCDFGFPMKVRRQKLHKLLCEKYHNMCSFEPLIYPGVKLQYYWNQQQKRHDGICRCKKECYGKGDGAGDGDCKKVTIAVFDSGKTLITGANHFDQVEDAYAFICRVIRENTEEVKKLLPAAINSL